MADLYSTSGAATTFANGVAAMARGDWRVADALATSLADSTAQGDFDATYGAMYAAHINRKA